MKKKKKDVCSISFCLNREEEKHSRITRSSYQEKGVELSNIFTRCVCFFGFVFQIAMFTQWSKMQMGKNRLM